MRLITYLCLLSGVAALLIATLVRTAVKQARSRTEIVLLGIGILLTVAALVAAFADPATWSGP